MFLTHSSCHGRWCTKMNLKPGGKQAIMHDTYWKGQLQCMVSPPNGTPKALKNSLMERGIKVQRIKFDATRNYILDFLTNSQNNFVKRKAHAYIFLKLNFHCELNPTKKCWTQANATLVHIHCTKYTIQRLQLIVSDGLDFIIVENIRNYFRKSRNYMFAYVHGQ